MCVCINSQIVSKIQSFEQKTKTYILDFVPSSGNAHLFKPRVKAEPQGGYLEIKLDT